MSILIKRLHYLPSQKPGRVAPDVGTECTLGNGSKPAISLGAITGHPYVQSKPWNAHSQLSNNYAKKHAVTVISPDTSIFIWCHFIWCWKFPFWMGRKPFPPKLFIWPAALSGSWRRHQPAHRVWCPLRVPRMGFGPRSAAGEPTPHCGPGPPLWTSQTAAPADPEEACRGSQRE